MGPYDILYAAVFVILTTLTEHGNASFKVMVWRAINLVAYEFLNL